MRLRFGSAPAVLGLSALVLAACGARTSLDLPGNSGGAGGSTLTSTTVTSTSHATTTGKTTVNTGVTTTSTTTSSGLSGPVISPSGSTIFDAETSIAIDPASKRLASAWIAVTPMGGSNIGFAFSSDGTNWTPADQIAAPNGRDSSDPVVAVDASGAFYVSFVAFHRDAQGMPSDMHVYVAKAPPGSNSFGPPVEVSDPNLSGPFYDKPWITVTQAGTIAVSYADADNSGYKEAIALSTDGVNWTRSHVAGPSQSVFFNLAYLCPDRLTKRLHATFVMTDAMATHLDIGVAHSDDEGHTWSAPQKIAGPSTTGEQPSFDDPTCFAQGGTLLVSYGIANAPPPQDASNAQSSFAIRLAELEGNGSGTVTKRMDIQDPASGKAFQHPTIAGDETGRLAVVYYAAIQDEDTNGSYRVGSLGTLGNISVHPTQAYVDPIFATVSRSSPQWLGDYTGLVVDKGTAYTSFVTNQNTPMSESEIAFTKMTLP